MLKIVVFCVILSVAFGAVMHGHSHTPHLNKEREADGAFSPKDRSHFSESGEHRSEFDHEAILGSHKEAEEFDHLPPEESKRRLEILLHKMDLNGDKEINRSELKAWLLRSFKMLSEEEAKERLEDADEDNNGIVTWKEYLEDTYAVDGSDEISIENQHMIEDDKKLWEQADKNGDGNLSEEEWMAFSNPEEHPAMLPLLIAQTLREKDKDGDGKISFQEYVGERAKEHDKNWLLTEKTKFDSELDRNNDGILEGSEILSWVVPSNEEIADEETSHLFVSSDDDGDNMLSFAEILEHYDIFVGSEATDFGEHLHNIHHFEDEL